MLLDTHTHSHLYNHVRVKLLHMRAHMLMLLRYACNIFTWMHLGTELLKDQLVVIYHSKKLVGVGTRVATSFIVKETWGPEWWGYDSCYKNWIQEKRRRGGSSISWAFSFWVSKYSRLLLGDMEWPILLLLPHFIFFEHFSLYTGKWLVHDIPSAYFCNIKIESFLLNIVEWLHILLKHIGYLESTDASVASHLPFHQNDQISIAGQASWC